MISEHIEQREGVYYVPGTRISLDLIVYACREESAPICRPLPWPSQTPRAKRRDRSTWEE